jgi:hypothetical protein
MRKIGGEGPSKIRVNQGRRLFPCRCLFDGKFGRKELRGRFKNNSTTVTILTNKIKEEAAMWSAELGLRGFVTLCRETARVCLYFALNFVKAWFIRPSKCSS